MSKISRNTMASRKTVFKEIRLEIELNKKCLKTLESSLGDVMSTTYVVTLDIQEQTTADHCEMRETLRILCLSTNFHSGKLGINFGILHSGLYHIFSFSNLQSL